MTDPQQTHLIAALLNDRDGQPALATKDGRVIVGTSDEVRAAFGSMAVRIVRLPAGIAPTTGVREWWTASCQDSDEAAARLAGLDRCIADLAETDPEQTPNLASEQPQIAPTPQPELGEIRVTFPIGMPAEDLAKLVVQQLTGSLTDAVGVECIRSLRRALDESNAAAVRAWNAAPPEDDSSVAELAPPSREDDLLETAWGIIANAGEGDWNREHPEWKAAAERWRDSYLIHLRARNRLREAATSPEAPSEVESLREALETVLAKPTGLLYAKFVDRLEEPLNRDSASSAADAAASAVQWFLRQWEPSRKAEDSNLVTHARRELELLGETDTAFVDSIVAAVRGFCSFGHSGGSAPIAIDYLTQLLRYEPLSPITNDPAEWIDRSEQSGYPIWQNIRDSRAMSHDGGKTYWLVTDQGDAQTRPKYIAAEPGVVTRGEN